MPKVHCLGGSAAPIIKGRIVPLAVVDTVSRQTGNDDE